MAILISLPLPGPAWAEVGVLAGDEDFKLLANRGFAQAVDGPHADGSPLNSYAWSMEWFNNALLVGTLRNDGTTMQRTAQIWRYTPGGAGGIAGTWKMVYQSPLSFYGPKDLGYRWMTPCNVGGTSRLYVTTMGSQKGRILYSDDGITFREATTYGLNASDVGYRPLVCFKDPGGKTLLITSPVGVGGSNFNADFSDLNVTELWMKLDVGNYQVVRFRDAIDAGVHLGESIVDQLQLCWIGIRRFSRRRQTSFGNGP